MPFAIGPGLLIIHAPKMGGSWLEGVGLSVGCSNRNAHTITVRGDPPESHCPLRDVHESYRMGRLILGTLREPVGWHVSWWLQWAGTVTVGGDSRGELAHQTMAPGTDGLDFDAWLPFALGLGVRHARRPVYLPGVPNRGSHPSWRYWHDSNDIDRAGGLYPYIVRWMYMSPLHRLHLRDTVDDRLRLVRPGDAERTAELLVSRGLHPTVESLRERVNEGPRTFNRDLYGWYTPGSVLLRETIEQANRVPQALRDRLTEL